MALTSVTVIKKSVNQSMKGQYSVTWELKGFDGEVELFGQLFSEDYKTGDDPVRVVKGFKKKMQAKIDSYKIEQVILANHLMDDAVTAVQALLEV